MRRVLLVLALLLIAAQSWAATVTAAWDPPTSGDPPTGYKLLYGPMTGSYVQTVDVGNVLTTTLDLSPGTYFLVAVAYNTSGTSGPSNEVQTTIAGSDPCAYPLGPKAIQIFVTGKLNKTGSQGPGSGTFITFRAFSPNSPLTFLSVRANGVDILDSIADATGATTPRLNSFGALWFTMPPLTSTFSVFARNLANCARDQPTGFSVTFP
jgi:hypothetical protein